MARAAKLLAANLTQFNTAMKKAVQFMPAGLLVKWQKDIVLAILEGVVDLTPVITGRARGNWQVTIGKAATSETGITDKDGDPTKAAGLEALTGLIPMQVVFIANNVPYVLYLEEGTEHTRPRAMLARTLQRAKPKPLSKGQLLKEGWTP